MEAKENIKTQYWDVTWLNIKKTITKYWDVTWLNNKEMMLHFNPNVNMVGLKPILLPWRIIMQSQHIL